MVANSVTALAEINEASPETGALLVTPAILKKLLMALNECTEYVFLSNSIPLVLHRLTEVDGAE